MSHFFLIPVFMFFIHTQVQAFTSVAHPQKNPPLPIEKTIHHIAFGSCIDQDLEAPIWKALLDSQPDFYIGLGDNVYASTALKRPIKKQYEKLFKNPSFKKLYETLPILATWDDHDYGLNDGGMENPYFSEARTSYLEFFPNSSDLISKLASELASEKDVLPRPRGIEHSVVIGKAPHRIQIILLDTRSYRSPLKAAHPSRPGRERYEPTIDPQATLLGEAQWKWLERELKKEAEVRFLISSIQFLAEGHGYERWGNLPLEQTKLWSLLEKNSLKNLILISGDRHLAEIFQKNRGSFLMTELTTSALNKPGNITFETEPDRKGNIYNRENFGTASIDWSEKKVSLSIRDLQGKSVETIHHNFSSAP